MELRPIQSTPVYPGTVRNVAGRETPKQPHNEASFEGVSGNGATSLLSNEETAFFEGLFPESRNDVHAHKAYSTTGEQRTNAVTGSLIDRKG
jgi:hypothetical protein